MRFAVLGGDKRMELLCGLLLKDGHKLSTFAMEKAELSQEIKKAGCLQACVYGADCVLLPVPAEKAGLLYNPLSDEIIKMQELIPALWKGQIVCGGKFSTLSRAAANKAGLNLTDIMEDAEFIVGNAALTAEGALMKLMENSEKSIWGSRILVCGWGRIGKLLSLKLKALGAKVSVAARARQDRALAEAMGVAALSYEELEGRIGEFDFIVNTVPERVITKPMLCLLESGSLIMELASPPGGFDKNLAENIGLKLVSAPGLPGKTSPYTGAVLMKNAIYRAINEQGE